MHILLKVIAYDLSEAAVFCFSSKRKLTSVYFPKKQYVEITNIPQSLNVVSD